MITLTDALILAQNNNGGAAAGIGGALCGGVGGLLCMALWAGVIIVVIAGLWKVFEKAGKPGWAAIVPIYNMICLVEISGKELWWIVLFFLPVANIIAAFVIAIEIAKKFGKDTTYGIGLALLPFIFYPLLGFSDAQYQGHKG